VFIAQLRGSMPGPTNQGCGGGESLTTCERFVPHILTIIDFKYKFKTAKNSKNLRLNGHTSCMTIKS